MTLDQEIASLSNGLVRVDDMLTKPVGFVIINDQITIDLLRVKAALGESLARLRTLKFEATRADDIVNSEYQEVVGDMTIKEVP